MAKSDDAWIETSLRNAEAIFEQIVETMYAQAEISALHRSTLDAAVEMLRNHHRAIVALSAVLTELVELLPEQDRERVRRLWQSHAM